MGLFGKNKNKIVSLNEFTANLQIDFAACAVKSSYLEKDEFPVVPEVMMSGNNFALSWLQNENFARQFEDPENLYFNIANFCFFAGAYYSYIWHTDFQKFNDGDLYGELYEGGVQRTAAPVMPFEREEADKFCAELFNIFISHLEPYFSMDNYRKYIFNGMATFFNTGSAIQMKSMGF